VADHSLNGQTVFLVVSSVKLVGFLARDLEMTLEVLVCSDQSGIHQSPEVVPLTNEITHQVVNAFALGVKLLKHQLYAVITIWEILTQLSMSKKKTCRSEPEVLPAMVSRGAVNVEYLCFVDSEKDCPPCWKGLLMMMYECLGLDTRYIDFNRTPLFVETRENKTI